MAAMEHSSSWVEECEQRFVPSIRSPRAGNSDGPGWKVFRVTVERWIDDLY
jgi:hypothetical protein